MFKRKKDKPIIIQTGSVLTQKEDYETSKTIIVRLLGIDFLQILPLWVLGIIILITHISIPKITIAENTIVIAIVSDATILLKAIVSKTDNSLFRFIMTLCKETVLCAGSVIYVLILAAEHHEQAANMVKENVSIVIAFILLITVFVIEIVETFREV